jgi:hypothetical protein
MIYTSKACHQSMHVYDRTTKMLKHIQNSFQQYSTFDVFKLSSVNNLVQNFCNKRIGPHPYKPTTV